MSIKRNSPKPPISGKDLKTVAEIREWAKAQSRGVLQRQSREHGDAVLTQDPAGYWIWYACVDELKTRERNENALSNWKDKVKK